jgi:murein DD-endopeptidase MepM/ murein hydrolase activator NlpD
LKKLLVLLFPVLGTGWLLLGTATPGPAPAALIEAAVPKPAPRETEIPLSDGFDLPVGESGSATAEKDGDGWYNAQGFGRRRHLGEDWNTEAGGNSDCGEPVFAASAGHVLFAEDLGGGWGQVVLLRHRLPDGGTVETLYAHLDRCLVQTGETVRRGQQIATVGDAEPPCGDGKPYSAHLHFELRRPECPDWGRAGAGYGLDATGWEHPSRFIEANRNF